MPVYFFLEYNTVICHVSNCCIQSWLLEVLQLFANSWILQYFTLINNNFYISLNPLNITKTYKCTRKKSKKNYTWKFHLQKRSKEWLAGITEWRHVVLVWQFFRLEILWPVFDKKLSSEKCAKEIIGICEY